MLMSKSSCMTSLLENCVLEDPEIKRYVNQ